MSALPLERRRYRRQRNDAKGPAADITSLIRSPRRKQHGRYVNSERLAVCRDDKIQDATHYLPTCRKEEQFMGSPEAVISRSPAPSSETVAGLEMISSFPKRA
jgi:hypothetical protein